MKHLAPLLLLLSGCASPMCQASREWIDHGSPDIVTNEGIRVWLMRIDLDKWERRGLVAYLDAVHLELRERGIFLTPARVGIWPRGAIPGRRRSGGVAILGRTRCPIAVVWRGPLEGPDAFAHEELHRKGWDHTKIGAHTWMVDELRYLGREALMSAMATP